MCCVLQVVRSVCVSSCWIHFNYLYDVIWKRTLNSWVWLLWNDFHQNHVNRCETSVRRFSNSRLGRSCKIIHWMISKIQIPATKEFNALRCTPWNSSTRLDHIHKSIIQWLSKIRDPATKYCSKNASKSKTFHFSSSKIIIISKNQSQSQKHEFLIKNKRKCKPLLCISRFCKEEYKIMRKIKKRDFLLKPSLMLIAWWSHSSHDSLAVSTWAFWTNSISSWIW